MSRETSTTASGARGLFFGRHRAADADRNTAFSPVIPGTNRRDATPLRHPALRRRSPAERRRSLELWSNAAATAGRPRWRRRVSGDLFTCENELEAGTTEIGGVPFAASRPRPFQPGRSEGRYLDEVQAPCALALVGGAPRLSPPRRGALRPHPLSRPISSGRRSGAPRFIPDRSALIPCLHDEAEARLAPMKALFARVRGAIFNSAAEQSSKQHVCRLSLSASWASASTSPRKTPISRNSAAGMASRAPMCLLRPSGRGEAGGQARPPRRGLQRIASSDTGACPSRAGRRGALHGRAGPSMHRWWASCPRRRSGQRSQVR